MRLYVAFGLAAFLLLGVLVGLRVVVQAAGIRANDPVRLSVPLQPPVYLVELHGLQKNSAGISSRYVITNEGMSSATAMHVYYDDDNLLVTNTMDTILPLTGQIYDLASIAGIPDGYHGYVIVSADQPITGMVLETILTYTVELRGLQKDSVGISSRYVITNEAMGAQVNTIHEYYDESSQWITTEVDTIPQGASRTYDLALISSIPDGYRGYVIVSADQPITGMVLQTTPIYTVELRGLQRNSTGVSSRYVITNEATTSVTATHKYHTEAGQLVATMTETIFPLAGQTYDLALIADIPDGYRGYVIVSADQPITGTVLETFFLYLPLISRDG